MWPMPSSSPISVVVARKSSRRHQLSALIPRCASTYILFYLMHESPLTLMLAGIAYNTYSIVSTSFIQVSHQLGCIPVHGTLA